MCEVRPSKSPRSIFRSPQVSTQGKSLQYSEISPSFFCFISNWLHTLKKRESQLTLPSTKCATSLFLAPLTINISKFSLAVHYNGSQGYFIFNNIFFYLYYISSELYNRLQNTRINWKLCYFQTRTEPYVDHSSKNIYIPWLSTSD